MLLTRVLRLSQRLLGPSWRQRASLCGFLLMATLGLPVVMAATTTQTSAPQEQLSVFTRIAGGLWQFAIWLGISITAAKLMSLVWQWILLPLSRRTSTQLDSLVLTATRGPVQWVVLVAVLSLGARSSVHNLPEVTSHVGWAVFQGALFASLVLTISRLAYGAATALTEWLSLRLAVRNSGETGYRAMVFFRKTAGLLFLFIALTIIFDHFGIQITGLLATAGVASLAVALAAQESLANMIAGFALMADRAFQPGDRIELANGKMGDVMEVGLRSTKIMAFDNTVINIPNSDVAKSQIINLNAPNSSYKIRSTLGVAYGTDLRKTKRILLDIFAAHPEVLQDPPPGVYFTEFGDSALKLFFVCAVADYKEQFRIRDELNMAIKDRFEDESIQIPFPQHDVHLVGTPAFLPGQAQNHAALCSHKSTEVP